MGMVPQKNRSTSDWLKTNYPDFSIFSDIFPDRIYPDKNKLRQILLIVLAGSDKNKSFCLQNK